MHGGNNLVVKYNKNGRRVWGVDFRYGYPNMIVETKDEGLLVLGNKGMVKYRKAEQGYEEEWDSTILTAIEGLTVFRYITETSDGGFTLAGTMNRNITLKDATTSTTLNLKGSDNIKATNTGDLGGYVTIKDIISDKVNFEVGSLKENGSSSTDLSWKTADDLANGIQVYVPERQGEKAGESILSFTVQVKDTAEGDIENKATWIDGEKIEENQTKIVSVPVVVFEKKAEVIRNSTEEGLAENTVTVNDKIKYIIKLQNTGTADSGSFTITDVIPENTKVDSLNISDDGKIQGNKIIWNIESLKTGETREVNFIATVKYNTADKLEIKNTAYINEKPSNEVVKEYIKPVTKLITDITKDGDDTVLIGNGIKYKIEYTETVENFIGKANVVIVDQLPYEIDEEKSNFGDDIYNKETKTITWTVQQDNIDTYTSGNINNIITKELLLYYKTDKKEQMIENTVKVTTQLIKIPEEVVETQEKTAYHLVNIKQMTSLPETGGVGIEVFMNIGLALIGMAIIILVREKKS